MKGLLLIENCEIDVTSMDFDIDNLLKTGDTSELYTFCASLFPNNNWKDIECSKTEIIDTTVIIWVKTL